MLPELQAALAETLLRTDTPAATALAQVRGGKLTPERRIAIYRHNVQTNLRGALADLYPVVAKIVGDAFFMTAASEFIAGHPSRSGDLNDFGGEWAAFLETYPHAGELHYLPDVARLEWAWHRAFHAADADGFDLASLAAVPAEAQGALRFRLHPAVQLLASPYPLFDIWRVNQPDYAGEMAVDWDRGVSLLLRREGFDVVLEPLSAGAFRFLSALSCGGAFEAAAEAALAAEAVFDLQGFLLHAVQSSIIVGFDREIA